MSRVHWKQFSDLRVVKKHIYFVLILLCFSLHSFSHNAHAKDDKYERMYKEKYSAFVMDADTGLILHRENANKRLHPASLTKMMTLAMLFDALDNRKIKMHHRIRMSENAASMVPSKLGIPAGSTIKVKDAIYALSVKSANDVAVAVAEKLGGTEQNFAKMMTKKARTYGMMNTRFMNASGLHDPKQVSSSRDMAKLARVMIIKHKKYYPYFSKTKFVYRGKTYKGHNKLMETYEGMDGLKTGYIRASGFNLASSAVRNNRRIIGVVFGGKTGKSRNAQMEILLDDAFAKLNSLQIAKNNVPIPQKKPRSEVQIAALAAEAAIITPPQTPAKHQDMSAETVNNQGRWSMLYAGAGDSMFNRMIGEGDYDINVRNRIETGLIAISAQLGEPVPNYISKATLQLPPGVIQNAKPAAPVTTSGSWAIQIGAFTTRERTDNAIADTLKKLPTEFQQATNMIAPLETKQGWIFRGRLMGYSKSAAYDACKLLADCIPIPPHAYQQ